MGPFVRIIVLSKLMRSPVFSPSLSTRWSGFRSQWLHRWIIYQKAVSVVNFRSCSSFWTFFDVHEFLGAERVLKNYKGISHIVRLYPLKLKNHGMTFMMVLEI